MCITLLKEASFTKKHQCHKGVLMVILAFVALVHQWTLGTQNPVTVLSFYRPLLFSKSTHKPFNFRHSNNNLVLYKVPQIFIPISCIQNVENNNTTIYWTLIYALVRRSNIFSSSHNVLDHQCELVTLWCKSLQSIIGIYNGAYSYMFTRKIHNPVLVYVHNFHGDLH